MKKYKNVYPIIGSIIIALGLIFFSVYITKCHGGKCNVGKATVITTNEGNQQVFSKMIPSVINEQVKNKEIVLLDVREDSEWEAGHIFGAEHIALGNLNAETTKNISKDMLVYTYCHSGKRAKEAETKLRELGFSKAEDLGGIVYWQERGGELVR